MSPPRETFSTRFGLLMTMIGVAVGLGNVWRFPYMVGKFGGATFVLIYLLAVVLLGVPTLIAEWTLGRHTGRGVVGAFARGGLPLGRQVGWLFFCAVAAATAYYTNALGWVLYHGLSELAATLGRSVQASSILPPQTGFSGRSLLMQLLCTGVVLLACGLVLVRGLRSGIEKASKWIMPGLLAIVALLLLRSLTLPGADEGVRWFLLKFEPGVLSGSVVAAAVGQAFFSLSLGGTFMVVYGSYLGPRDDLRGSAVWTACGDLLAGMLAGLAIVPAVIALGHQPASGPRLIFDTLPRVFDAMPFGPVFGSLFFFGLFGAAYLSALGALEVLVAGLVDNTRLERTAAVWLASGLVFALAIPPMLNMRIFLAWDLTFGSGMQVLGALLAVITVTWILRPADVLRQYGGTAAASLNVRLLYQWTRLVVPAAILAVGIWWLLTDVLGVFGAL